MKRIAVVTATRAEYGLLLPVIRALRARESADFRAELIVTGTHLSDDYGRTEQEIRERIDRRIPISVKNESAADISANQAEALVKFTELFAREAYDGIVLLGDRYETLAVAVAAGNTRTPVFHLCGGDTTEGAMDEWIRHAVTKISILHFVTNEDSRRRVIQLGEDPARVFNFGSTSIDNLQTMADMGREEALASIGLGECRYALCTYHPVTMEAEDTGEKVSALIEAMRSFPDIQFIITGSNADRGGSRINRMLAEAAKAAGNLRLYASLGVRRYLSLMKTAEFVLGNSSSGIIETPALHVPTVDIGDRQRGRLASDSVIHCGETAEAIREAIRKAMSEEHRAVCRAAVSPYGNGNTGEQIAEKIAETVMAGPINLKKKFYDLRSAE
jgi:GDP/UDP-N,N'-diacetylbacillosamine 2-epimerase (hydrolysing)